MAEEYLTVAEAAGLLRVSDKTVRRLLWGKEIPYTRLGTNKRCRIRIRQSAIARFMASREKGSKAA